MIKTRRKNDNSKELDNRKRFQTSYCLMIVIIKDLSNFVIIVTIRMILMTNNIFLVLRLFSHKKGD